MVALDNVIQLYQILSLYIISLPHYFIYQNFHMTSMPAAWCTACMIQPLMLSGPVYTQCHTETVIVVAWLHNF